mmetsp:Transcript_16426/g.45322  ORF Transcript_16426/g.45322 Transcript_16426/m.45322 type:complete len:371 (+) Transcript_16426:180-1292(+)
MLPEDMKRVNPLCVVLEQTSVDDYNNDYSNDYNNTNMIEGKRRLSNSGIRETSANILKIEERLNNAIEVVAMSPYSITKNRSPDLVPLTTDYEQLKKKLRTLIGVLKTYQKRTRDVEEARFEIAEQLALLSEQTPIQEEVGCELDSEATERLQKLCQQLPTSPSPTSPTMSFVNTEKALNQLEPFPISVSDVAKDYRKRTGTRIISLRGLYRFGAAEAVVNDMEYQTQIVQYVTQWLDTITDRVDSELKRVRKLASGRLHYERKVETLRNRADGMEDKGKNIPASAVERLSRNEDKLKDAFTVHEKEASKLCALIESVTQEGYNEIYTLIRNYIEWEINRIGRENDMTMQLNATLSSMSDKVTNIAVKTE